MDNIINMGIANDPPPLTAVLRQCIVLANDLKAPLLRTWAEQELNGYPNPKDVPEYRVIHAEALGNFAGVGVRYQGRPIPTGLLKPEHRWAGQTVRLTEPVSAYEALDDAKGALIYYWPSNMIGLYQSSFLGEGCVLMTAWQQVPKTAIAGVLDTIRTRVLTMAIDIKNESEESGVDLNHVERGSQEAQQIQRSVVTNVYGNLYMIAGDHVVNTQNIAVGNWEDLKKVLNESGIGDEDVAELSQAIEKDGKTMGADVRGWISRNAGKVLDHGLKLGTSVGTTLLTEYLKRHFGLP
ncbi:MAG: hypothetical protein ABSG23_09175 [Terriglobales bacterium]